MTRRSLCLLTGLCMSAMAGGLAAPAQAASRGGWVYTLSNVGALNQNSVLAHEYGRRGALRPLRVREYSTRGTGEQYTPGQSLGAFSGDQQVTLSPDGRYLFAVNQGSDTVAVFAVNRATGALKHVPGSPFASGGDAPMSVGVSGKYVIVANHGYDTGEPAPGPGPSNYVSFKMSGNGKLRRVSTLDAPASGPMQAAVSPDGDFVFGDEFFSVKLRSIELSSSGRLADAPGSPQEFPPSVYQDKQPPPGAPPDLVKLPFGVAVHPTEKLVYYLAAVADRMATYRYDDDGRLSFVGQVDNTGAGAACWVVVTPNGRWLYTANTVTSNISLFDLSDPESPRQVGTYPVQTGGPPFNLAVDPSGSFLFAIVDHDDPDFPRETLSDGNFLETFRIRGNGALAPAGSAAIAAPFSALPYGLATLERPPPRRGR